MLYFSLHHAVFGCSTMGDRKLVNPENDVFVINREGMMRLMDGCIVLVQAHGRVGCNWLLLSSSVLYRKQSLSWREEKTGIYTKYISAMGYILQFCLTYFRFGAFFSSPIEPNISYGFP